MELLWWLIAIALMAIGLIGTVLPVVPGTTIILGKLTIGLTMVSWFLVTAPSPF